MKRVLKIGLFFLCFVFLFSFENFSFAQINLWSHFAGNEARTGSVDFQLPDEPKILWHLSKSDFARYGVFGGERIFPVIGENKIFINFGKVFAIDLKSGKILWSYFDEKQPFFPYGQVFGENKVFVVANDTDYIRTMKKGRIYALLSENGKLLWQTETDKSISHSQPLFAQGKIFIGDDSGKIYAFSAENGKLIWKTPLEAEVIHSSPAFYQDRIYVGTEGSQLTNEQPSSIYCLDSQTGKIVWRFLIDYEKESGTNLVHATPAIVEGKVYFGSENGWFYAISAENGNLIWKKQLGKPTDRKKMSGPSAPAAIKNDKVFVATWNNEFFALNAENGDILWQYKFEGEGPDSAPIADDKKVCFGIYQGNFQCLEQETGKIIWSEKFGGRNPASAQGILVIPYEFKENEIVLLSIFKEGKYNLSEVPKTQINFPAYLKYIFVTIFILVIVILLLLAIEKIKKRKKVENKNLK